MKFKTSSNAKRLACIYFMVTFSYLFGISMIQLAEYRCFDDKSIYIALLDILVFASVVFFAYRPMVRFVRKQNALSSFAMSLLVIWELYLITETSICAFPIKISPLYNILGLFMVSALVLPGLLFRKGRKAYWIIIEVVLTLYSLVQYYIISFRGGPIKFSDVNNIRSATDIQSSYKLFFSFTIALILLEMIGLAAAIIKHSSKECTAKLKLRTGIYIICGAIVFALSSKYSYTMGIRQRYITFGFSGDEDTQTYRNAGNLLTLYYSAMYERLIKPDGYSADAADKILSAYKQEEADIKPMTVIGIMNESFSDFSHIADFEVSQDYIPYYRSLNENVIKGYVTVSAYGGYSCNSEWEFLTGNSMYFAPSGYAAFTNCMMGSQSGLVSYFNDLGYETISLALCSRTLWNLENAYNYLGFKTQYYRDNISIDNPEYINGNLSDETAYRKIIDLYEARNPDKGLFIWTTTLQNHAEYDTDVDNGIELLNHKNVAATRYLNTIKASDIALKKLLNYFKDVSDPVMIVFFGDHYPHIPSFTSSLYGQSIGGLSLERYKLLHETPYMIWSNKPMATQRLDNISLNYLSIELIKAAGLPLTPFWQFQEKVRLDLPIISGFGYMDKDGKWYNKNESGPYDSLLNDYNILEYQHIFGD